MYAINKKDWSHIIGELQTHPGVVRIERFFKSPRVWTIASLVVVLALIITAIIAMVMFALWVSAIDLTTVVPMKMIN